MLSIGPSQVRNVWAADGHGMDVGVVAGTTWTVVSAVSTPVVQWVPGSVRCMHVGRSRAQGPAECRQPVLGPLCRVVGCIRSSITRCGQYR